MKKLLFLLSLLLVSVTSVKSQVYKFNVTSLTFYDYPLDLTFTNAQSSGKLSQHNSYYADFTVTIDLNQKVMTLKEPNKPEVRFDILTVDKNYSGVVSFTIEQTFANGVTAQSFVDVGRVDNTNNFFYSVEHVEGDKMTGGIDFSINKIEVSK